MYHISGKGIVRKKNDLVFTDRIHSFNKDLLPRVNVNGNVHKVKGVVVDGNSQDVFDEVGIVVVDGVVVKDKVVSPKNQISVQRNDEVLKKV